MLPPGLTPLLITAGVMVAAVLPAAGSVTVGTTSLDVESAAQEATAVATGQQLRARATVVHRLEPPNAYVDADAHCPEEGCAYQLVLVDPAAVNDGETGCDTLDYAVVDADPDEQPVAGAAQVYTGQGPIPRETADPDAPNALTTGVGLLCFANPAHADGLRDDAGAGPLVTTQPSPLVVVYDRRAQAGGQE